MTFPQITSPIDWALVESTLVDWATSTVPQLNAAIMAHQNAPQPARPYCVFTVENVEQKGDDDVRLEFDSITGKQDISISGQRVLQLGIDVISGQQDEQYPDPNTLATAFADRLVASLQIEEVLQLLRDVDIAVASVGNVENLTALEGAQWVSRARFIVRLNVAANATPVDLQQGIIDSTEVEGPQNLPAPPDQTQTIDGGNPP